MFHHKRYMGGFMHGCLAAFLLALTILPIAAIPFVLISEISLVTVAISFFLFGYFVIMAIYTYSVVAGQLYAWCDFDDDKVTVHKLLHKSQSIYYKKCRDVGIAFYTHGVLNSKIGSDIFFIYFSYSVVEEKYKNQINLLRPSASFLKITFKKESYQFLINALPPKQSAMLAKSYANYKTRLPE